MDINAHTYIDLGSSFLS